MERRLWPASSRAWTVACLARMRLANRSLLHGEVGTPFGRSGIIGTPSGRFEDEDAQALAVVGDGPLGGLAEVVPQVPPVSDLDRLGCPGRGAFREERSPVPADHLDPGALRQPLGQAGCLPVGQQVHRPTGLAIDQNGAVDAALARRVLIDADHPWGGRLRLR
ncbi:hypothetical protein AMK11_22110 [Streptomyces sp. CB02414]|nr:hypothetical protein AMK11_22110 [Streptomyces sp. CB02414]